MLLSVINSFFFLLMSSISLHEYTTTGECLSILLLMNIWDVSRLELL